MFFRGKLGKFKELWLMTKWTLLFVLLGVMSTNAAVYSQTEQQISLSMKDTYLKDVLWAIERQTTFVFMYNQEDLDKVGKISVNIKAADIEKILKECLRGTGLTYVIEDAVIVLKPVRDDEKKKEIRIAGRVTDEEKQPLPGVTVRVKGINLGTATNTEGKYSLTLPEMKEIVLVYSFVGMITQEVKYAGKDTINVVLKEDKVKMDEVVVTGYMNVRKESFTGNATTVTRDQLMKVNSKNVIAALQTFDPSFRIKDNKLWGSDPNALPEFNIRGETSIGQAKGLEVEYQKRTQRTTLENNPNLPVFILDGFEVDVQKIYDLDVNRIESMTILKDAAATAMYGSQAANGVVVVTTVAPEPGKMQVNYRFAGNVDCPDLSDYNLCNAAEKLEVERLSGLYTSDDPLNQAILTATYNQKQNVILKGVDTDWMSKPLRNVFGHMHSLSVSGGEESIRYGIDLNYNASKNGVMKGSYRHVYGAGLTLDYRAGSWLQLVNNVSYTVTDSEDSPYGQYTQYAQAQPYAEIYDEDGNLLQEITGIGPNSMRNPLWKVANLSTFYGKMKNRDLTDNFQLNINILEGLMFKGQLGLRRTDGRTEDFTDPADPNYSTTPAAEKGELNRRENYDWSWNGKAMFYYNHSVGGHFINATAGVEFSENNSESTSYILKGFQLGNMHEPQFAATQPEPVKVSESTTRKVGLLASVNYAYNDIYLFDGSLRMDGSSDFGRDKQFAPFWSVGAGLNMHNYGFLKDNWLISRLKVRISYGSTGNVGFAPYTAITTFQTATDAWSFTGPAATLMALGNSHLKWQTTNKLDAGFNIGFLHDRVTLEGSYYRNETKDLIDDVKIPAYSGFTSYKENSGSTLNEGFEVSLTSILFQDKDWMVTFMGNLSSNKNKITKLSAEMNSYNETVLAEYSRKNEPMEGEKREYGDVLTRPLILYYEGKSLSAIYAVRSEGIDPANGRERFIKKNGMSTYTWDANDQVVVGDSEPDAKGSFGFNVGWKGITLNAYFSYQWGGQSYNSTLVEKVENAPISEQNVDKRVLSARWKNAGDIVPFYDLSKNPTKNPSSRFVQDDNRLDFTSLSVGYDFGHQLISKWRLTSLSVQFSANDLCKWRSVKEERAINYPFARSFSFSLNLGF